MKSSILINSLKLTAFLLFLIITSLPAKQIDVVKKNIANLNILPSETHELYETKALQDGAELVVYGKVKKLRGFCLSPGHVDLTITDSGGKTLHKSSLPYIDRGSRRKGWYGAGFRVRLPITVPEGSTINLAFHGPQCHSGNSFECENNIAENQDTTHERGDNDKSK